MIFQYGLVPKIFFPVWLQNHLKSAELEPVLIHTDKLITDNFPRVLKLKSVLLARSFDHSELTKLVLIF